MWRCSRCGHCEQDHQCVTDEQVAWIRADVEAVVRAAALAEGERRGIERAARACPDRPKELTAHERIGWNVCARDWMNTIRALLEEGK